MQQRHDKCTFVKEMKFLWASDLGYTMCCYVRQKRKITRYMGGLHSTFLVYPPELNLASYEHEGWCFNEVGEGTFISGASPTSKTAVSFFKGYAHGKATNHSCDEYDESDNGEDQEEQEEQEEQEQGDDDSDVLLSSSPPIKKQRTRKLSKSKTRYIFRCGKLHGKTINWRNGRKYYEYNYKNGKLDGWMIDYDLKTGKKIRAITYRGGIKNGKALFYYKNQKAIHRLTHHKHGRLNGVGKEFYRNGIVKSSWRYRHGKREGVCRDFYEDGHTLHRMCSYRHGWLHGKSEIYYRSGKLKSCANYDMGILKSKKKYKRKNPINQVLKHRKYHPNRRGAYYETNLTCLFGGE